MSELELLLTALCRIPAPSGMERARAEFICDWFRENGCGAFLDEVNNVILPFGAEEGDLVIVAAHTDTVFPDTEPLQPEVRGTRLYCPGAGDDTANLAILMIAARDLCRCGRTPRIGIVFAADSCEEGLGNLAGCRALMARYGARVREFVSFDLYRDSIYTRAVGSARYRITLRCRGGHSFGDFGNRSAIHAASELVCALYAQKVPAGGVTTWNVGTISGGTTVNAIAEQASLTYEYRSDSAACMEMMEHSFRAILAAVRDAEITCETLGVRPGMGVCCDSARQETLIRRAEQAIVANFGERPRRSMASTDCNIPFSLGIPSVCFGLIEGGGVHTRGEYVELGSLEPGLAAAKQFLESYFREEQTI